MESSPYVDRTLELYRRSRAKTPRVGIALQAYLYRTEKDIESLVPLGAAIRVVKGAYLEPPDIAFPKKADVDANYFKLCTRLMAPDAGKPGALLHIATHDIPLADRLAAYIHDHRVPASAYEFAMYWEFHERGFQQAVRMGDWKAVRLAKDKPLELYNLADDPTEFTDVASKHADVIAKIEAYLKTARTESPNWPIK